MADLTKLTTWELLLAEIRRRLERLDRCEAALCACELLAQKAGALELARKIREAARAALEGS